MKRLLQFLSLSLAILIIAGCMAACSNTPPSNIVTPGTDTGSPDSGNSTDDSNSGNVSADGNSNSSGSSASTPTTLITYLYDGTNLLQLYSDDKLVTSGSLTEGLQKVNTLLGIQSVGMNSHCAYLLTKHGELYMTGSNEKGMLGDPDLTLSASTPHHVSVNKETVLQFSMSETLCVALTEEGLYAWGELHDKGNNPLSLTPAPWEGISSTPVKIDLPNGITPKDVTHLAAGSEGFGLSAKGRSYYLGNYAALIHDAGNVTFWGTAFLGQLEQACAGIKSAYGANFHLFLREDGKVFVRGMPISDDLYYQWGDHTDFENLIETPVWQQTPVAIQDIAVYESGALLLGEDGSVYAMGKLGKTNYSTLQRVVALPCPMAWVHLNAYGCMMVDENGGCRALSYDQLADQLRPVWG